MRDLVILFIHLIVTAAILVRPGGARAVVVESLILKHQLVVLNRGRERAPNRRPMDRTIAGFCTLFIRPGRLLRVAIVGRPSTLLAFHAVLVKRKYQRLFSPQQRRKSGPKGPSPELITAIVATKKRNPRWGCRRIAQQLCLVFGAYCRSTTVPNPVLADRHGYQYSAIRKTAYGASIYSAVNRSL